MFKVPNWLVRLRLSLLQLINVQHCIYILVCLTNVMHKNVQ